MRLIDADKAIEQSDDIFSIVDGNGLIPVGMTKAIVRGILTIESITPTIGGWISVKERLPEKPGRYLCWFGKNTFAVGASIVPYIPDLHWFVSLESLERYENVTHWMPLPGEPKEAIE